MKVHFRSQVANSVVEYIPGLMLTFPSTCEGAWGLFTCCALPPGRLAFFFNSRRGDSVVVKPRLPNHQAAALPLIVSE